MTRVYKEICEGEHQSIYSFIYMLMPFGWALVHKYHGFMVYIIVYAQYSTEQYGKLHIFVKIYELKSLIKLGVHI